GEMLKDKSKACAAEAQEMAKYLVGQDPRPTTHHWQAIYRHGFYRGGPVLTAVLSGIDMALWDIKGKSLGLPVHELLGGPTRQRIRVYGSRQDVLDGKCTAMKGALRADDRPAYKYVESAGYVQRAAKSFQQMREQLGPDICYAGGITELRLIAGIAETFYVPLAPHNPQGPCSLAASCQIAAAIPNFLIQEQGVKTHENLLKNPFKAEKGYLPVSTAPGL